MGGVGGQSSFCSHYLPPPTRWDWLGSEEAGEKPSAGGVGGRL